METPTRYLFYYLKNAFKAAEEAVLSGTVETKATTQLSEQVDKSVPRQRLKIPDTIVLSLLKFEYILPHISYLTLVLQLILCPPLLFHT